MRAILWLMLFSVLAVAGPGLLPPEDPTIPLQVRQKLGSVFRVIVLTQMPNGKTPMLPLAEYEKQLARAEGTGFFYDFLVAERKKEPNPKAAVLRQIASRTGSGFL